MGRLSLGFRIHPSANNWKNFCFHQSRAIPSYFSLVKLPNTLQKAERQDPRLALCPSVILNQPKIKPVPSRTNSTLNIHSPSSSSRVADKRPEQTPKN